MNGVPSARAAPAASASPCSDAMKAWLSMMPVEGDSSAATPFSAGSISATWSWPSRLRSKHAVGLCMRLDLVEPGGLFCRGGDNQLAQPAVRNAAALAIGVEPIAAFDAEPGLEAARRIVDAGMDDFTVAARGLGADPALLLRHDHLATGTGQGARDGQADHTGADNQTISRFHRSCSRTRHRPPMPPSRAVRQAPFLADSIAVSAGGRKPTYRRNSGGRPSGGGD